MMSKSQLYHIVCTFMLIAFVASCGRTDKTLQSNKIQVTYWYVSGANDQAPASVALFNASRDDIEVIPVAIPWKEHEKKVLTAILSGNPPDLINLVTPISKWASRMALMSLDDMIAASTVDSSDFFASNWYDVTHQGSVYGLPMHTASYAFFYNKGHFREAGLDPNQPPATWDELAQISKLLDKRDDAGRLQRLGFLPDYGNTQMPMIMAWQRDAEFLQGDTLVTMDNEELMKALEWVERFYADYTLESILGFRAGLGIADQQGFISGKLSMMVLDNTFIDQIGRYAPNLDYGVSVIPTWPDGKLVGSTGTWWVAIPRGAKNAKAAWEFLQFATGLESQREESMTMTENLFPANRLALTDSIFLAVHPTRRVFVDMLAVAASPVVVSMAHDVFWREYNVARDQVFYGRQTPAVAFEAASRRVQRELNEALEYDRYVRAHVDNELLSLERDR